MEKQEMDKLFFEGHLTAEGIALYADAMLKNKMKIIPAHIREHVEECFQCKEEIFSIYGICSNEKSSDTNLISPEQHRTYKVKNMILQIAASILLLVALSFIIYHISSRRENTESGTLAIDKTGGNHDAKQIAQNNLVTNEIKKSQPTKSTSESSMFEELISSRYRNPEITILRPKLNQKVKVNKPIVFEFSGDLTEPCQIKIFNNRGVKILETDRFTSNSYAISKQLIPGLYYWKLEQETDLLGVSKFIVVE